MTSRTHQRRASAATSRDVAAAAQLSVTAVSRHFNNRIVLPADKVELRKLLKFLDEDYYESPLSKTRFVSSSKRVAG